jgi:hypothetical protein
VPGLLRSGPKALREVLDHQKEAVNGLNDSQVFLIATGEIDALGTLDENIPKSIVVGVRCADDSPSDFGKKQVVAISPLVEDLICDRHMKILWKTMAQGKKFGWGIFAAYTRYLMLGERELECRRCVGKKDDRYYRTTKKTFGGCSSIELVTDIVAEASQRWGVVFHPVSASNVLIDFIYQDERNHIHAFQVTTGFEHKAKKKDIKKLTSSVADGKQLSLYFLVPSDNFLTFTTEPVEPKVDCDVWHVQVPDPSTDISKENPETKEKSPDKKRKDPE